MPPPPPLEEEEPEEQILFRPQATATWLEKGAEVAADDAAPKAKAPPAGLAQAAVAAVPKALPAELQAAAAAASSEGPLPPTTVLGQRLAQPAVALCSAEASAWIRDIDPQTATAFPEGLVPVDRALGLFAHGQSLLHLLADQIRSEARKALAAHKSGTVPAPAAPIPLDVIRSIPGLWRRRIETGLIAIGPGRPEWRTRWWRASMNARVVGTGVGAKRWPEWEPRRCCAWRGGSGRRNGRRPGAMPGSRDSAKIQAPLCPRNGAPTRPERGHGGNATLPGQRPDPRPPRRARSFLGSWP